MCIPFWAGISAAIVVAANVAVIGALLVMIYADLYRYRNGD